MVYPRRKASSNLVLHQRYRKSKCECSFKNVNPFFPAVGFEIFWKFDFWYSFKKQRESNKYGRFRPVLSRLIEIHDLTEYCHLFTKIVEISKDIFGQQLNKFWTGLKKVQRRFWDGGREYFGSYKNTLSTQSLIKFQNRVFFYKWYITLKFYLFIYSHFTFKLRLLPFFSDKPPAKFSLSIFHPIWSTIDRFNAFCWARTF